MSIVRAFRRWWLRRQQAAACREIEYAERVKRAADRQIDYYTRRATELAGEVWAAEHPRAPVGTTLRSLNAPITRRAELRRIAGGAR